MFTHTLNSILYVEDEQHTRDELKEFLGDFCTTLHVASNGEEGLDLFKNHPISLVVSDIKMPEMNGIDMCREIKKIDETQPFIFLTAFKDTEYLMNAIDLQVNGYIPKPINLDLLQRKLDELRVNILWQDIEKKRQQEIETVLNTTLDGIAIIDFKTNFLFCNSAFEELTGYSKEELFTTNAIALASNEYTVQSMQMVERVISEGSVKDLKIAFFNKNRGKIYLNMGLSLIPEEEKIIIACQDVTELKKKEQQLKDYINIVNENVLTSTTDLQGSITYSSEAFCKLSGYTKEELNGATHSIINHPDMPQEIFEDLWKTITQDQIWKGEIKNKKKNGEEYWVNVTITPIFNLEHNEKIGYTAIHYDITDKKTIERLSKIDPLTELHNRRYFDDIFLEYSHKLESEGMYFSFMIIDIDYFK